MSVEVMACLLVVLQEFAKVYCYAVNRKTYNYRINRTKGDEVVTSRDVGLLKGTQSTIVGKAP